MKFNPSNHYSYESTLDMSPKISVKCIGNPKDKIEERPYRGLNSKLRWPKPLAVVVTTAAAAMMASTSKIAGTIFPPSSVYVDDVVADPVTADRCSVVKRAPTASLPWCSPPRGFLKHDVDGAMLGDGSAGGMGETFKR
ncbi:hypothetical protein V6N13_037891 [Hibiscus sabdariffa]